MKILIVSPYMYPKVGGLESYVYYVALNLKKIGHEVVIATSNHLTNEDTTEYLSGILVYRLKIFIKISNTPINPFWFFKLNHIINEVKPDIIFAQTPVPFIADISAILAYWKKIPFTLTYHAGSLKKNRFLPDLLTSIYVITFQKILFALSKKIVVLNEFVQKTTLKESRKKVTLILPGITLHKLTTKKQTKNKPNRILFVGNLDKANSFKGFEYLLFAFKEIHSEHEGLTLHVVGGGDNLNYYKELSKKLDIIKKINFYGQVDHKQISEYYSNADILVLPTISNAESLGLVILEAMSFGLPIVATLVGGIPYVVKNNINGILVRPGDSHELGKAISKTLQMDSYRLFSEANFEMSKKFNWLSHVESLTSVFKNCTLKIGK